VFGSMTKARRNLQTHKYTATGSAKADSQHRHAYTTTQTDRQT